MRTGAARHLMSFRTRHANYRYRQLFNLAYGENLRALGNPSRTTGCDRRPLVAVGNGQRRIDALVNGCPISRLSNPFSQNSSTSWFEMIEKRLFELEKIAVANPGPSARYGRFRGTRLSTGEFGPKPYLRTRAHALRFLCGAATARTSGVSISRPQTSKCSGNGVARQRYN